MSSATHDAIALTVTPVTPRIGGVIRGIDLRTEISKEVAQRLREALLDRQVLFLPDQDISPEDQLRFAQIFGAPRPVNRFLPSVEGQEYVELLESTGRLKGTDIWHTDVTWQEEPNDMTCLHAQEIPECGGDTLWASMTAAYDELPPDVQRLIDPLFALHDWQQGIAEYVRAGGDDAYEEARRKYPPVRHPVVRVHPETARKLIYVNKLFPTRIEGLDSSLGDTLLDFLSSRAHIPEYQVRYRWSQFALAIWDNRAVQHYAVGDYSPHSRRMHRVTIGGSRPYGPSEATGLGHGGP